MHRFVFTPIRSRRIVPAVSAHQNDVDAEQAAMTPATRKTLAAIGALWVSFATSASIPAQPAAPANALPSACNLLVRGYPGGTNVSPA